MDDTVRCNFDNVCVVTAMIAKMVDSREGLKSKTTVMLSVMTINYLNGWIVDKLVGCMMTSAVVSYLSHTEGLVNMQFVDHHTIKSIDLIP